MNAITTLFVFGTLALAGCATPFRASPEQAHIDLQTADSPVVMLTKTWLERNKEQLVLAGYVVKRRGTTDTTQTHLDVTLFDREGHALRRMVEYFEPRQIPRRPRMPDSVTYRVVLDPFPPNTTRIEVRAHEGTHD